MFSISNNILEYQDYHSLTTNFPSQVLVTIFVILRELFVYSFLIKSHLSPYQLEQSVIFYRKPDKRNLYNRVSNFLKHFTCHSFKILELRLTAALG